MRVSDETFHQSRELCRGQWRERLSHLFCGLKMHSRLPHLLARAKMFENPLEDSQQTVREGKFISASFHAGNTMLMILSTTATKRARVSSVSAIFSISEMVFANSLFTSPRSFAASSYF